MHASSNSLKTVWRVYGTERTLMRNDWNANKNARQIHSNGPLAKYTRTLAKYTRTVRQIHSNSRHALERPPNTLERKARQMHSNEIHFGKWAFRLHETTTFGHWSVFGAPNTLVAEGLGSLTRGTVNLPHVLQITNYVLFLSNLFL